MRKVTVVSRKAWHYRLYTLFGPWFEPYSGISACEYWAAVIFSPLRLALLLLIGAVLVVLAPFIACIVLWDKYGPRWQWHGYTCPLGQIEFEENEHGDK